MPGAPVLLVVDDDQQARGVVEGELRKRYGADYQVICAGSADDPPGLLAKLRDDQRRVSIVLAGESVSQLTGTKLLARVREFHSTAKRLLLIHLGIRTASGADPAGHRARPHRRLCRQASDGASRGVPPDSHRTA